MNKSRIIRPTVSSNNRLALENSLLEKRISLREKTIENSLSSLADGLTRGGIDSNGYGMSNLTSLNPMMQNNMYAPVTLMWTNLMYFYKTHGLVQTAIDMPVLDAIRGGLDFHSDGQIDADDLKKLTDYIEENSVLERIADAFIWARLFGGGAVIINTEQDSEEPLGNEINDGGKIDFYDACRWELTCERRIPMSGKYGYYGKKLDESRVITILGKRAPWLIRAQLSDWGMSEIERAIESFNMYLRTNNVIYEILNEAKVDVFQLSGFAGSLASPGGTQITTRRIQQMNRMKNFNNALIMDSEDKYETKQLSFGGLAEIKRETRMEIAAAFRMPQSKLFGIPSVGFSSGEDDIENYNGLVESEVRQPMKTVIRKVLKIIVRNLFGDDLNIDFKFKPLRILSGVDEESIKSSKSTRYLALFDKLLMDSREVGEALQKDNLVPIPLKAEQGLLDDHPVAEQPAGLPGDAAATGEEEGAEPEKVEGAQGPTKQPASGKPATPPAPKKPKPPTLNERKRQMRNLISSRSTE